MGKKAETPPPQAANGGLYVLLREHSKVVALIVVVVCVGGFWSIAWWRVGDRVLASPTYTLKIDDIQITPLPDWVHSDLRAEALANLGGNLSINDPALARRIADALATHPWVAQVQQVRKLYPAAVRVDIVYRRPACMVVVPRGLLPVDSQGVLLPTGDFSPVEAERYPRLAGISTNPVGPVGTCWGDPNVVGGAQVSAAIGDAWGELKLDHIAPAVPVGTEPRPELLYKLYTRRGTCILWGRAPTTDMPGEVPASDKVARLKKYIAENGSLEGRNGPQELDVRSLRSMEAGISQ
jgi:hypothetical protein